jgi:hypothetical protein
MNEPFENRSFPQAPLQVIDRRWKCGVLLGVGSILCPSTLIVACVLALLIPLNESRTGAAGKIIDLLFWSLLPLGLCTGVAGIACDRKNPLSYAGAILTLITGGAILFVANALAGLSH